MANSYTLTRYKGCKAKRRSVQRDGGAIAGATDGVIAPNTYTRLVTDLGTYFLYINLVQTFAWGDSRDQSLH